MRKPWTHASVLAPWLALVSFAAHAHSIEAPATLDANADGSFSYVVIVNVGPGSVLQSGGGWWGLENVAEFELSGDCFCDPYCTIPEGTYEWFHVEGQLVDPSEQGAVYVWVDLCGAPFLDVITTVLPYGPTAVDIVPSQSTVSLSAQPNPFSETVELAIELERATAAAVEVVDVRGRVVRRWETALPAGTSSLRWDGRAETGARVGGGIYFVRLAAGGATRVQKLVFVGGTR